MKHPDYGDLYRELGQQPDCGIEGLQHAYRRHVADLHPDRGDLPPGGSLPLSELNVLYHEAIRFHRRHGRLPGASQARASARVATTATETAEPVRATAEAEASGTLPDQRTWWWLLLVAAIIAASLFGFRDDASPDPAQARSDAHAQLPAASARLPTRLAIGMEADTVLAIQGEPVQRSELEWNYGPSWLRFEDGKLVDWYSSPLYPLRTGGASPPDAPPEPSQAESDAF